jgi:hypothetical protein
VEAEFVIQFPLNTPANEQRTETQRQFVKPTHGSALIAILSP